MCAFQWNDQRMNIAVKYSGFFTVLFCGMICERTTETVNLFSPFSPLLCGRMSE